MAVAAGTAAVTAATDGNLAASLNVVQVTLYTMYRKSILLSSVALSALLTGCVGTGPNTQQGAVGGAALGALAGAIIGNNSGSHNGAGGAAIGALAGALAGGTLGNAKDNEEGTLYTYQQPQRRGYYRTEVIQQGPPAAPAPISEVVPPAPAANALWIPGYWDFNGTGYTWSAGRWEIPPPMSTSYIAAHWETRDNVYVFVRGYWR